jgi:hypothetical protein
VPSNAYNGRLVTLLRDAEELNDAYTQLHGVHPRPVVHNHYTSQLPDFFRRLGRGTDAAVRKRLVDDHGVSAPWPP